MTVYELQSILNQMIFFGHGGRDVKIVLDGTDIRSCVCVRITNAKSNKEYVALDSGSSEGL